jgi:hypothetical protein
MDGNMEIMTKFMDVIAKTIDDAVQDVFNTKLGFALLLFPFEETDREMEKVAGEKGANYVSNANQEDMIKFLRETADRLEGKQIVGKPIGSA